MWPPARLVESVVAADVEAGADWCGFLVCQYRYRAPFTGVWVDAALAMLRTDGYAAGLLGTSQPGTGYAAYAAPGRVIA